jgi:O-antigen ligase
LYAEVKTRFSPESGIGIAVVSGTACSAAVLGSLAVYSPKIALWALLGAAFVALTMWRLPLAVAAFVILTFPEHLPGAFGAGDTLAKPVGALILAAWVGHVLVHRGAVPLLPRERPLLFWVVVAFLSFGAASALWAESGAGTRHELGRFVQVMALLLVVYTAGSSRPGFRTIVRGYLFASVITSIYSLAFGSYVGNGRLATLFDPNYFAAELLPALAIALFVIVTAETWFIRCLAVGILGIDLVAFVLTQSRGGIVGLIITLVLALIVAGRARPRLVALVLVIVAAGLAYYFAYKPAHIFQASAGAGLSAESSGRLDEWHVAALMFETHPLGGVGLGNYTVAEPAYSTQTVNLQFVSFILQQQHVAHNTYLQVAAELGVVGIVLFLALLAAPFRVAVKALASAPPRADLLQFYARGVVAGCGGMLIAYIFITAEAEKQLWLMLGLLACVPNVVAAMRADAELA